MKKIMHILFLSCLRATELIEKKLHFSLSWTEKIQLKTHKMMCGACTRYEKQSELIEKGLNIDKIQEPTAAEIEELKRIIGEKLAGTA